MTTLVIWGEDDHKARAQTLANACAAQAQAVGRKPKKVSGLDTLTFWGHGDASKFCGLDADEFVDFVSAWRKANSGLRTVEMLTCNARHRQGTYGDSYTERVATKLTTKHDGIRFRALPVATSAGGRTCEFSILKWHPGTTTWAYVAATGDKDHGMWAAVKLIEDLMPPRGGNQGYQLAFGALQKFMLTKNHPYATKRNLDQAQVDAYNAAAKATKRESYVIAGNVGTLRWCLGDIR
ncbi:MAG: hypothetical protein R6V44_11110 [Paracoccaceae bacterium]